MVIRWKIAVQDYDFDIEHIPGVDNIVADGLSRLIADPAKPVSSQIQNIPQTMALLCPFEPERVEDYLFLNIWEKDFENSSDQSIISAYTSKLFLTFLMNDIFARSS